MREARYGADASESGKAAEAGGAPGKRTLTAGIPLPSPVRSTMERSFGVDLSPVRVHHSGEAEAMGAEAFAQGTDIHMAAGRYDPGSHSGRELIGHEVAHVVQQSQGRVSASRQYKGAAINDDPALEAEADEHGARAARGESATGGSTFAPGPLPALQSVVHGPRQGFFKHGRDRLDDEDRDAVSKYLHARRRVRREADEFDEWAKDGTDHGTLVAWLKENGIRHSVAKIVDGRAAEADAAEEEEDEDGGDGGGGGGGAMMDGYDTDDPPEPESPLEVMAMYKKAKEKEEAKVERHTPASAGRYATKAIRHFRAQSGRLGHDEKERFPPVLTSTGSRIFMFEPNPWRKDVAVAPMRRSESGNHLQRDGNLKTYDELAKAIDKDCKDLGLSPEQMNANIRYLRETNRDAREGELPNPVSHDCLDRLREMVMILLDDHARSSRASDVIESEALGAGSFAARFGGASPSYRGAPKGGSKALQEYTAAKKKEDGGDEDGAAAS